MEASGIYHHIIFHFLKRMRAKVRWPFKIVVVNPSDAAGLPGKQKYDRIDAENLAKYLSNGLLKNGKAIIEALEDLKAIFRMAARLEKDRTALKNRIKKTLDRAGIRPRSFDLNLEWSCQFLLHFLQYKGSLGEFLGVAVSEEGPLRKFRKKILKYLANFIPYADFQLTPAQSALVRQDLIELDFKTGRKALLAVEIDQVILDFPALRKNAHNLASIPGISPFSAVWILSEIGNIRQFPKLRQFIAYCGCTPRIVSSAGKVYSAHISRHSNSYLRTIFYNAAVVVCNLLKRESELKEYATRTVRRKGGRTRKVAYCTVATKIAKITYAILRDGIPFSPFHREANNKNLNSGKENLFSVTDRKILRRARNTLKRVKNVENIGLLGERAKFLAKGLDKVLSRSKEKRVMIRSEL